MKKLTALLLTAAILLGMAACAVTPGQSETTVPTVTQPSVPDNTDATVPSSEPVTEPSTVPTEPSLFDKETCAPLFGTWVTTITLDNDIQHMADFKGKVTFSLYYSFYENGVFWIHMDWEEGSSAFTEFESLMVEHMVEKGYLAFRAEKSRKGYSKAKIDAMWAESEQAKARAQYETTISQLNLFGRFQKLLRGGEYYVLDGRLYTALDGEKFESSAFTLEEGVLTLKDTDNLGAYRLLSIDFPMTLTKPEQ